MQLMNGALFLNATALFLFASFYLTIVIVPFTIIHALEQSHKSDLNIEGLILISLLTS